MFKKELLKDRHIGVFIENEEQVNLLAKWIEENADRQYNRYDSKSNKHIADHVLFTSYEHGNCYEFDDKKDAEKKINKIISFKKAIALEPVSNFNNTWCEATEENYNVLHKLEMKPHTEDTKENGIEWGYYLIVEKAIVAFSKSGLNDIDTNEQIQLIDGEFYYTDSIKDVPDAKCMFAKYGLEVPKNIEKDEIVLLGKDSKGTILGTVAGLAFSWRNGKAHRLRDDYKRVKEFDLTPIKKPWYEDEGMIGKIISYDVFDYTKLGIFKGQDKDAKWIKVLTLDGNECAQKTHKARLATKEEVLSLYKEQ